MSEIALGALEHTGRIRWTPTRDGWIGDPDEIVRALSNDGFEEYKHELATNGHHGHAVGGLWQGLNKQTGAVGSAVWIRHGSAALVFVDIDGARVRAGQTSGAAA